MGSRVRDERAGFGERYGIAINARSLEIRVGSELALDRICAMAYARIEMSIGDEEQKIVGELAPLLWRAAYGRDDAATILAGEKFASWLCLKLYFGEIERAEPGLVRRFAFSALDEWLSLRCPACGGGGWQEVIKTGKRVRPTGRARNAPKAICQACRGTGRPKPSPQHRMRLMSSQARKMLAGEYFTFWHRQFGLAFASLRKISTSPRSHLQTSRESV